jgi:hypothetical protein
MNVGMEWEGEPKRASLKLVEAGRERVEVIDTAL